MDLSGARSGAPLDGPGRYRVFKKPFDGQELLTAVALMLREAP